MSMLMLRKDRAPRIETRLSQPQTRKLLIAGTKLNIFDTNAKLSSDSEGARKGEIVGVRMHTSLKPQDAEFVVHDQLLYKLDVEIFAGVSCSTYWKMQYLNREFLQKLKCYDTFRMRRECGLVEPYVFMLPGGEVCWTKFDKNFENFEKLPAIQSDYCFYNTQKETICAGTHLTVVGKEMEGIVVWRYELETHQWVKGPAMIIPRCMYGSASRGTEAFFAGGISMSRNRIFDVVNTAEKYNSQTKTWTTIHGMHKRRKWSSGCFLRGRFYVLGGKNENNENLTCGESYDEETDSWKLIPNMLGNMTVMPSQSPPLIAVANNNLYSLEASSNVLRVYDINTNTWKKVGVAPVRANVSYGWGVAFMSIGDRLLLIGSPSPQYSSARMRVFTCRRPSRNDVEELIWEELNSNYGNIKFNHFIRNCCVMFA